VLPARRVLDADLELLQGGRGDEKILK